MKILALYNLKGGVGKTAGAVNLAYLASRAGLRTLVWDLDPQGAATFYFRVEAKVKGGRKAIVARTRRDRLHEQVRGTDFEGLDLVPADFDLRTLDVALDQKVKRPGRRLRKLLDPLAAHYDVAFLDCAPSISVTSEAVFETADALLVPTIPTTLSLRTLDRLEEHLAASELAVGRRPRVWPFFCMLDRRKALHQQIIAEVDQDLEDERALAAEKPKKARKLAKKQAKERRRNPPVPHWLGTSLPYASDVERMGVERAPLQCFAPRGAAARAYRALWTEISERISEELGEELGEEPG